MIIIIIIARFSKIQIHLKSLKKVKQRISLERRRLAGFEVLIAHFLCVKITISFFFLLLQNDFLTALCILNNNRVLKHNA